MAIGDRRRPLAERVLDKFSVSDSCWIWTASLSSSGYGQINSGGRGRPLGAHRVIYELAVGPIPSGLELDHLCRNRACVNPDHLEPVTRSENVRRGTGWVHVVERAAKQTRCKWGHEFTPDNTYIGINANGNPARVCRRCRANREAARRANQVHAG